MNFWQLILRVLRSLADEFDRPTQRGNPDDARQTEALQQQLNRAVTQYASVNAIFWTVFSIFAAGHAVLVDALVQSPAHDGYISAGSGVVLSIVGVFGALAWILLMRRTVGHLVWNQRLIERLEADAALRIDKRHRVFPARVARDPGPDTDGLPQTFRWFHTAEARPDGSRGYGPPAKLVMQFCTWATLVGWVLTLGWFVIVRWWLWS